MVEIFQSKMDSKNFFGDSNFVSRNFFFLSFLSSTINLSSKTSKAIKVVIGNLQECISHILLHLYREVTAMINILTAVLFQTNPRRNQGGIILVSMKPLFRIMNLIPSQVSIFFSNALSGTDIGDHDSPPVPIFRHPQ